MKVLSFLVIFGSSLFIAGECAGIYAIILKRRIEKAEWRESRIGRQVILDGDTLTVVDGRMLCKKLKLSNGEIVSSSILND